MRNRSSKHTKEIEKLKIKEEPHLSGAYIRSLVKQLTSSRAKEPMNSPKTSDDTSTTEDGFPQSLPKFSEGFNDGLPQQPPPQPQPKKQVRRRLHTSRPYQERLLNMAEARREIVTALKFHRAAMKQANEKQQLQQLAQQTPQQQQDAHVPPPLELHDKMKSRRNPRIYPSDDTSPPFSNYLNNFPSTSVSPTLPNATFAWASPPPIAPLPLSENLNFALPNQPLGLHLNFHDFNNIDTSFYHNMDGNYLSIYASSSSSSSTSSSPSPTLTCPDVPLVDGPPPIGGLHAVMDDEEMAKIRSIGKQHDLEWNDTLNFVTSAWWFKFLKTMEIGPEVNGERREEDGPHLFDEVMDIPAWLNDGAVGNAFGGCFLQQHFDDFYSDDFLHDAALPCMDLGEIEGMDGDWLA